MDQVMDTPRHRYELVLDGHTAFSAYRREGDVLTFYHTVVPPALQGQGVASRLIAGALADVRAKRLKLIAESSFLRAYLAKHPEDQDLIAG